MNLVRSLFSVVGFHKSGRRFKLEETTVYCVQRSFYVWGVVLVGLLGALCVHRWPGTAEVWGWAFVWAVFATFVAILVDISTGKLCVWGCMMTLVWLVSKYVEDVKRVPVLTPVFDMVRGLHPHLDAGFAAVLGILLAGVFVASVVHALGRGRKVFSPNSVEAWAFGRGTEVIDRSGLTFVCEYRDLLESALGFGAGDIVARDSGGREVRRWENVLGLYFRWPGLEEILEQRSAVVDNAPADAVDVEVVRSRAAGSAPSVAQGAAPVTN